eukprot:364958-Chlamydomonas_euryale.AAC.3
MPPLMRQLATHATVGNSCDSWQLMRQLASHATVGIPCDSWQLMRQLAIHAQAGHRKLRPRVLKMDMDCKWMWAGSEHPEGRWPPPRPKRRYGAPARWAGWRPSDDQAESAVCCRCGS